MYPAFDWSITNYQGNHHLIEEGCSTEQCSSSLSWVGSSCGGEIHHRAASDFCNNRGQSGQYFGRSEIFTSDP